MHQFLDLGREKERSDRKIFVAAWFFFLWHPTRLHELHQTHITKTKHFSEKSALEGNGKEDSCHEY